MLKCDYLTGRSQSCGKHMTMFYQNSMFCVKYLRKTEHLPQMRATNSLELRHMRKEWRL